MKYILRHLLKNKTGTIINLTGLVFGLSVSFLIAFYVLHELSYDRFHENALYIYGIECYDQSFKFTGTNIPKIMAPTFHKDIPEIKEYTSIAKTREVKLETVENNSLKSDILYVQPNFFDFFTFSIISGNPYQILADPYSGLISKSTAHKYFGDKNPIGETIKIIDRDKIIEANVRGVYEDFPVVSSIQGDMIISMKTYDILYQGKVQSYLLLSENADMDNLRTKIQELAKLKRERETQIYDIYDLTGKHLMNNTRDIYVLSSVAMLILVISILNFVLLSTAQYSSRLKEIGVKKVIGAKKQVLVLQIMQ